MRFKLLISTLISASVFMALTGCTSLLRPQHPKTRDYVIEQVKFQSLSQGVTIAGELTKPQGVGPFPGVVLITGSGPQDRDETLVGHKPFLVLSDHLTKAGFAVFRYDDRGVNESTGDFQSADSIDFADDAAAPLKWLSDRDDIHAHKVGFIGHSEGGYIAPLAARTVEPAFIVMLASPARPLLPDVLTMQNEDIARAAKEDEVKIAEIPRQLNAITQILKDAPSADVARQKLSDFVDNEGSLKRQSDKNQFLDLMATRWAMFYADYQPCDTLREYQGPVYALFGGTDLQVSAEVEAPIMQVCFSNPDSKVHVVPGANHLFQYSKSGKIEDYLVIRTTMEPEVLGLISGWLLSYDAASEDVIE